MSSLQETHRRSLAQDIRELIKDRREKIGISEIDIALALRDLALARCQALTGLEAPIVVGE